VLILKMHGVIIPVPHKPSCGVTSLSTGEADFLLKIN
jgi:hypothetical protein